MTRHTNRYRRPQTNPRLALSRQLRAGFTLVEMLVVIVIIGILAAILLPVLGRAKESARQANCASNLSSLYLAISQYRNDVKRYPASLVFLLPKTARLDNSATTVGTPSTATSCDSTTVPGVNTCSNDGGGDYLKQALPFLCPDDDNDDGNAPRSSYGDVSTAMPATRPTALDGTNINRYVWNFFGYDHQGYAYSSPAQAAEDLQKKHGGLGNFLTVVPAVATTDAQATAWATEVGDPTIGNFRSNPIANSMSNRNAPSTIILTHCVYHRQSTSGLASPQTLYADTAATNPANDGASALEIVLRGDGSVKKPSVGAWTAPLDGKGNWQQQLFQVQ